MVKYKNPKGWEINPMSGNKEAPIMLPSVESWANLDDEIPKIGDKKILTQDIISRKKKGKKSKAKRKTKNCGCK
jgi:hypothetical protein